jgi:hypothetical protein
VTAPPDLAALSFDLMQWPNLSELLDAEIDIPALGERPSQYPPARVRALADKYASADPELAELLRKLAATPRALYALDPPSSPRGDTDTRNLNIALHDLVARTLNHHRVGTRARIAQAWNMEVATVKHNVRPKQHGADAAAWLEALRDEIYARIPSKVKNNPQLSDDAIRDDILQAIDDDLTLRAHSWPRPTKRAKRS